MLSPRVEVSGAITALVTAVVTAIMVTAIMVTAIDMAVTTAGYYGSHHESMAVMALITSLWGAI